MTPAHVFMTADAVGGVWTYALDLARGLSERGTRTTLAVLGPRPSADQRIAAACVEGLKLVDTGLPLDWTAADAQALARTSRRLAGIAGRSGAQVVHLNSPALAADATFDVPVVGVCHSSLSTWQAAVLGGEPSRDFAWRSEALARGLAACDAVAAPSQAFAASVRQAYGMDARVVRNGRAGVARPRLPKRERFVFTSGRLWDPGKNVAAADAVAGRLDAPVLAAGALVGPDGAGVALHQARPLGRLSEAEVADHLRRAPVFLSLAVYEPFGLGVLEAAQAGCALMLSDIAVFRELWDDAAVFVEPHDAEAAAAAARMLLEDPALCAEAGRKAARRARRYSLDAMIDGVLALYADALAGSAPAAEVAA